jgi:hypothetical protein
LVYLFTTDLGVLAFSFVVGEYSEQGVHQKLIRLGLLKEREEQPEVVPCPTSSKLELPDELSRV